MKIKNYKTYNERMDKSMIDKIFFLDKIPEEFRLVDFGCADGALLKTIAKNFKINPRHLIGYDIDEKMIALAKESCKEFPIGFTDDWTEIVGDEFRDKAGIMESKLPKVLILSSVIHEIYTYCDLNKIKEFWDKVFMTEFDYIVIRDMVPSQHVDRPSDINDIAKIYRRANPSVLTDFERVWGSIENNKNLVHFLLKYRYTEPNWNRELKENYIPISREQLLTLIPVERYDIIYHEHYVLPYIKEKIHDDFGIELKDPTHLKMILRCR